MAFSCYVLGQNSIKSKWDWTNYGDARIQNTIGGGCVGRWHLHRLLEQLESTNEKKKIEDTHNLKKIADLPELENKNFQMMIATNKID